MTRKMRRTRDVTLSLEVTNPDFLATPQAHQRDWHLNRIVKEAVDELNHVNQSTSRFVPGDVTGDVLNERTQDDIADHQIMEDWQIPVMAAMAKQATASHGDILEVGFGRGVGSDFIQQETVRSHTIIECNDGIVERFHTWRAKRPDADIRIGHGMWQDVLPTLGDFDGIFFHTYPMSETEYVDQVVRASTFAEHFFDAASRHLRPGGVLTYLTNESDSLSRAHQRAVLGRFSSISLSMLRNLDIPQNTRDALWVPDLVIVAATK